MRDRQREQNERRSDLAFVNAVRGVLGLDPIDQASPQSYLADGWPAFDDGNRRTPSRVEE